MSLLAMAVWDSVENKRTEYTKRTIQSLWKTVDLLNKHRLIIVDNNSCQATKDLYRKEFPFLYGDLLGAVYGPSSIGRNTIQLIELPENVGTARAINRAWQLRNPGEHCVKMDNDVVIHQAGWLDKLDECVARDPSIGIIGLKRTDLAETPHAPVGTWSHSQLEMLPHTAGQSWLIVERVQHVMGTCQLYSSALLDKIGYLYQLGGLYGFDDSLASIRSDVAGFKNCFYPHIDISHIDPGDTEYTTDKHRQAGNYMAKFSLVRNQYRTGERNIYHGPNDE